MKCIRKSLSKID